MCPTGGVGARWRRGNNRIVMDRKTTYSYILYKHKHIRVHTHMHLSVSCTYRCTYSICMSHMDYMRTHFFVCKYNTYSHVYTRIYDYFIALKSQYVGVCVRVYEVAEGVYSVLCVV